MPKREQSERANCPISTSQKTTQDTTSVLPGPQTIACRRRPVSPLFLAAFLAALLLSSPSPH